jgi:16S rRNA (cytosine967-C5)-methyltransferase
MPGKDARDFAVNMLSAIRTKKAWSNLLLKDEIPDFDTRDKSLVTALLNGVLQNRLLLDYYIFNFSSLKPNKISPKILDILRVGTYQLLFMDKIPAHAAVNTAVGQAKRGNPKAAGFVNALLRKIEQNKDSLPEISGDASFVLSVKYSHPEPLVNKLIDVYGFDTAEKILRANNKVAKTAARINTLKTNTDKVIGSLSSRGIEASKHEFLENCIYLSGYGGIEKLPEHSEGLISIQDTASQLAALSCGAKPGMLILDACSAPGGKAFILAQETNNSGKIIACDIHEHKLSLIENGAARLGISCVETRLLDATVYKPEFDGMFDIVLADVPCSGFGIIRKKPEIRYKSLEEIKELPDLQRRISENVSRYVKPGGGIVYSTCTILPEENQNVIHDFLRNNPAFCADTIDLPGLPGGGKTEIRLLPHEYDTDGFYIAKLRRTQ